MHANEAKMSQQIQLSQEPPPVMTPCNFSPSPAFQWLCDELFVKLEDIQSKRDPKNIGKPVTVRYYEVINHFIALWRKTVGNDIFPALILILPYRDRRLFNIRDYTLIKAICAYLKLPRNSFTEKRLLSWKARAGKGVKLSQFCVNEIKKRKSEPKDKIEITIDRLNECLDKLAEERNSKGRGFKKLADSPTFKFCLENMSFIELQFFFDILLKNRVIGGQEHKFLNAWHPDAQDYLSVVSDLRTVTTRLWDPEIRLQNNDLVINPGFAFAPQLAKKLSISYEKICMKLKNDFIIEEKMDGERIQLHYQDYGEKLKFFSRRGTDYTYLYGESIHDGFIGKHLKLNKDVKDCILDGEMITYDKTQNMILPFGLVKSSARSMLTKDGIMNEGYQPLFMVFDLIFMNGTSLANIPLNVRKEYLNGIFTPEPHIIELLSSYHRFNEDSIRKSLELAISMGSEGIVLKRYDSRYTVASRNDDWIKVKPEYLEQFGENMDLIVIGRDPGKKDSLMCGLAVVEEDEKADLNEDNVIILDDDEDAPVEQERTIHKFVSFCVIANGLSQEEFKQIDRKTRGLWNRSDEIPPPDTLLQFGTRLPIEWIDPKKSVVIEVKARSIDAAESNGRKFATGCTLYGGYCRGIREDKDWQTCYTLSEFLRTKNVKSRRNGSDQVIHGVKRQKKNRRKYILDQSLEEEGGLLKNTAFFRNLYFYVISDVFDDVLGTRIEKERMYKYIQEGGGTLIHNIISKQFGTRNLRIISGKLTNECSALIERGYDVINPQWIVDCVQSKSLLKLEPKYCFNVSTELKKLTEKRVDTFGDSYEVPITEEQLSTLLETELNLVRVQGLVTPYADEELIKIPLFLFQDRIMLFPNTESKTISFLQEKIKLYGGKLTTDIGKCNLIILPNGNQQLLQRTRDLLTKNIMNSGEVPTIPYIVNPLWIERSIEENSQVPEEDYPVI